MKGCDETNVERRSTGIVDIWSEKKVEGCLN